MLPGKYKFIAQLSEEHRVPKMVLITESNLSEWIVNFEEVRSSLLDIEKNIEITSGAFLTQDFSKIQHILSSLKWSDSVSNNILEYVSPVFNESRGIGVAVRSACQAEDLQEHSFAGIYESVLNVVNVDQLLESLQLVWCSMYSMRAIMEKLNARLIGQPFEMNIIVQRMLQPEASGVAFSCDPVSGREELYIEYVDGLGDNLVSGNVQANRITHNSSLEWHQDIYSQLRNIIDSAMQLIQKHVDIEWAYLDGQVWLLQARPVTSVVENISTPGARIESYDLYADLPASLEKLLPPFASYFNKKRKPLHDIGKEMGAGIIAGFILEINNDALKSDELCKEITGLFKSDLLVIDFSDSVRQLVINSSELIRQLELLMVGTTSVHFIVVREFIRGQYGVITRQVETPDGPCLVAEISKDGLLAMNRGSAVSEIIWLKDSPLDNVFDGADKTVLETVTLKAIEELGDVQVEWVFSNRCFYALDFSLVDKAQIELFNSARVMSQGYSRGEAFVIQSSANLESFSNAPSMSLTDIPDVSVYGGLFNSIVQELEELSTPPIIFSRRPYAALASLIPYVSGFVFEKGSLLSHLGVLLREKKIPAICDEHIFNHVSHGQIFELNAITKY